MSLLSVSDVTPFRLSDVTPFRVRCHSFPWVYGIFRCSGALPQSMWVHADCVIVFDASVGRRACEPAQASRCANGMLFGMPPLIRRKCSRPFTTAVYKATMTKTRTRMSACYTDCGMHPLWHASIVCCSVLDFGWCWVLGVGCWVLIHKRTCACTSCVFACL
jgi:hypothetical protein